MEEKMLNEELAKIAEELFTKQLDVEFELKIASLNNLWNGTGVLVILEPIPPTRNQQLNQF